MVRKIADRDLAQANVNRQGDRRRSEAGRHGRGSRILIATDLDGTLVPNDTVALPPYTHVGAMSGSLSGGLVDHGARDIAAGVVSRRERRSSPVEAKLVCVEA